METILALTGSVVPVTIGDQPNLWAYKSFYVTDIFHKDVHCGRCTKPITYVYVLSHPVYGESEVGSECVREVLPDDAIKLAMHEFHKNSCKINQNRSKNRVAKVKAKIPKAILEVWKIETSRGPVVVKDMLAHLETKLQLKVFLSQFELEVLRQIESKFL